MFPVVISVCDDGVIEKLVIVIGRCSRNVVNKFVLMSDYHIVQNGNADISNSNTSQRNKTFHLQIFLDIRNNVDKWF